MMEIALMMIPAWLVACGCFYRGGYYRGKEAQRLEQADTVNEFRRRIGWPSSESVICNERHRGE